jgi:UDP-glucose 4-epimerase
MAERCTVLVTGGAGFVGSHFARMAAEAGRNVVILDDLSGGTAAPLPSSIPMIVGDIGNADLVRQMCEIHRVERPRLR